MAFPGLKELEKSLELAGHDPKAYLRELNLKYSEKYGKELAELMLHGLPSLMGVDVSGALGTVEMLPQDIQTGVVPSIGRFALGVPADLPLRASRGYEYARRGEPYRAVESISPEWLRNPMAAYRWYGEGMSAKAPDYSEITKVTPYDVGMKTQGVQPMNLSRAYEREHSEKILRQKDAKFKERLYSRLAKAYAKGNNTEYERLLGIAERYNQKAKYPEDRIDLKPETIKRNIDAILNPEASEARTMPKSKRGRYRELQEIYE